MRVRLAAWSLIALAGLLLLQPALAQDQAPPLDVITFEGVIDPTVAGYLSGRLDAAGRDGAVAAVIEMNTPGGLDVSMRAIIGDILDSNVPVIAWVSPRGARAASAGTFLVYASHLAYMAEATELGAATPVNLGGEADETLSRKAIEDAVAFITELARLRGRDVDFAEAAVRQAASLGATDAAARGVVDGIASSLGELLRALDGRRVELADGSMVTLETWDEAAGTPSVTVRFQGMNLLQRLLHAITNPEIAFMLLLIGTYGIIFELYNPGIGLAGILGAVSLLLGFYALNVLPTNWAGVLLIVLAVIFFLVDLQTAGLGIWTAGGIAALVVGGLILFSGAAPALQLSPWAIAAAVAGSLVFFVSVMTAALRVRLRRPVTGAEGILDTVGIAKTDIAPEGVVMTKGTLWRARTMETGIAAGDKVLVKATEGTVLLVEPYHGDDEPSTEPSAQLSFAPPEGS
jgi:membrane-bound serine protease (ClpP class)